MEREIEDETLRQRESTRISKTVLMERIDALEDEVANLSAELQDSRKELETVMQDNFQNQERMGREIQLLRDLITSGALGGGAGYTPGQPKLKVREPDTYDGVRDDKVLGNFFFDMEEYLDSIPGLTDETQVRTAARYLVGSAKLWWRTRVEDKAAGRNVVVVDNWVQLKGALQDQFLPGNSAWAARNKLMNLKQTGKVSDYVKEFSSLMLEIKDMVEVDRLFHFTRGLQYWAQEELRRARVKTLAEAVTEAERLMDFRVERTDKPRPSPPKSKRRDIENSFWPHQRSRNSSSSKTKRRSSQYQPRRNHRLDSSSGYDSSSSSNGRRNSNNGRKSSSSGRRSSSRSRGNRNQQKSHHPEWKPKQQNFHSNLIQGEASGTKPQLGGMQLYDAEVDVTPRLTALAAKDRQLSDGSDRSHSPKRSVSLPRRKVRRIERTKTFVDTNGWKRRLFLVNWKHENRWTWEPAECMEEFDDKVQEFFERRDSRRRYYSC